MWRFRLVDAVKIFFTRITFVITLTFIMCFNMILQTSWWSEGFSTRIAFVISFPQIIFKIKLQIVSPFLSCRVTKGRSESDCELRLTDEPQNYDTLPDRHKSLQMPLAPLPVTKKLTSTAKKAHLMMSDEVHDYSEIYTPSTEVKGVIAEDSGGPTTTASTTSMSSHSEC